MVMIKRYQDILRWKRTGPWRLVYGRRKVGKSFFVKNETEWDAYYFVTRSRDVVRNGEEIIGYREFLGEFRKALGRERIVVDEFQRLPSQFLDLMHERGVEGELTLVTSSKFFARSVLGAGSPLLGLVTPFPMGLVSPSDVLASISPRGKKDAEKAFILQEPWTAPLARLDPEYMLANALRSVPGLLGEIATEEDRRLTETYDAILEAVAVGENTVGKIASYMAGKFPERGTKNYTGYLKVLEDLGLIHRVRVHGKRRSVYVHVSPVIETYYRVRRRYGYPEVPLSEEQVAELCRIALPRIAEHFFRHFMAQALGEPPSVYVSVVGGRVVEADAFFPHSRVVVEVKWHEHVDSRLLRQVHEKLRVFKGMRGVLVVPETDVDEYRGMRILDVEGVVEMARKMASGGRVEI